MTPPDLHLDHSILCLSLLLTGTGKKGSQIRVSAYPRLSRHGLKKPFRSGKCPLDAGLVGGWFGKAVREGQGNAHEIQNFTVPVLLLVLVKIRQIYFDNIEKNLTGFKI